MKYALAEIAAALGANGSWPAIEIGGWSVDSRTLNEGDLFFALRGPAHDGHTYLETAFKKGAAAAIVDQPVESARTLIRVGDTQQALSTLATWARVRWGGDVVGVTGSAGKTTTKDAIARLLSVAMPVGATTGNFNNHVGVPLSILRVPPEARVAVIEIGMNHAGEIRELCRIARPRIGVVTNVGSAHIENFDSIEGVAASKRELIEALPPDGVAVLNFDDPLVARFADSYAGRVVTFGFGEGAGVRAGNVEYSAEGSSFSVDGVRFESRLPGRHGVLNVLTGIAVCRVYGIDLQRLVEPARTMGAGAMRGTRIVTPDGVVVWNDCYNSNPDAARAMLDVLRDAPAERRIAVLGEMLELGRWAETLHREVGRYAAASGVSVLVGVRGAARSLVDAAREAGLPDSAAYFFDEPEPAGEFLRSVVRPGDAVLFKGSRGTRVERALERFLG